MYRLENDKGTIRIKSDVFTTLAGLAASNCFGVKGMAYRSKSDGLVHLLRREVMGKGVRVDYNEQDGILIELHIVVDNGVNIPAISDAIKNEVTYKVREATGVPVGQVDIFIDSMMLG